MKKKVVIGISIFSVFILCSIPYQSIVADTSIEEAIQKIETKISINKKAELNKIFNNLVELKFKSDDYCDCKKTKEWPFPFICFYLSLIFIWRGFLATKLHKYSWWVLADQAWDMAITYNCYWTKIHILI